MRKFFEEFLTNEEVECLAEVGICTAYLVDGVPHGSQGVVPFQLYYGNDSRIKIEEMVSAYTLCIRFS